MHYLLRTRNATCPCPSLSSQKVSAPTSVPPSVVSTAQFTSRMGMPLIIYCGSSVKSFGHVLNNLLLLLLLLGLLPLPDCLPSQSLRTKLFFIPPSCSCFSPRRSWELPWALKTESLPGAAHNHLTRLNCLVK